MKLSIQEGSTNYAAKVVTITNVLPIDGKDLIQKTTVFGNNVIISKSAKVGDKCIYFCSGTKLSEDYCKYNNLYDQPSLNLDQTKKGYISHKARVKAIKLGGIISDGILMPLISLVPLGFNGELLKEGDEFTHINDILICEKYFVPVRNSGQGKSPKQPKRISRLVDNQFYLHNDTENLRRNIHKLNPSDIIGIHYKKHGCLPAKQKINMYDGSNKKIKDIKIGDVVLGFNHHENKIVPSVVKNTFINGSTDFWYKISKDCKFNDVGKYQSMLYLTENHEVFIKGKGYCKASDCRIGDEIIISYLEEEITKIQKSILEGILISDGYLDTHNTKFAIRYGHKKNHENYLDYIQLALKNICTGNKRKRISGYGTDMIDMGTKQLRQINNLFSSWVIDGKKEVPNGFKLDKYNLAFWYMGDGSLHHTDLQKDRADFAICGFSEQSSDVINSALIEFGFNNFRIYKDSENRLRLKLNASDAKILFDTIFDIVPEVMQYKLPNEYRNKFSGVHDVSFKKTWFEDSCTIGNIEITTPDKIGGYSKKYDIETETSNFFSSEMLIHNSSAVIGNVLVKKNHKWYEKLLKKVGVNIVDTEYDIVYSSRKVVKNEYLNPDQKDGFYGEDIWGVVAKEIGHLIPKGWTIYGEILGYLPSGGAIQKKYDYGCKQGEHKFYVYKISVVNIDGKTIYLTDKQIEEWCEKVGLLYKDTFIYYGTVFNYLTYLTRDGIVCKEEDWREKFLNYLEAKYNEKDCYMCVNKVPEEGIVLRIERLDSYEAYKLKSKRFILMESDNQEQEVSNIEDEQ